MKHAIANKALQLGTKKMWAEDERLYTIKEEVEGINAYYDISYDEVQCFDYYLPCDETSLHPIYIVDIHGGAWIYGDKKLNRHFCMHLAKEGFVVFNVNYDLAPDASIRHQLQQLFTALKKIRSILDDYGMSHFQLALSGDSAGAHLAGLMACIMERPDLQKLYDISSDGLHTKYLLLQHGVHDLRPMLTIKRSYMRILYHWLFPKGDEALRRYDSLAVLLDSSWHIPVFLLSSKGDTMFSFQSEELAALMKKLQLPYELLMWDTSYSHLQHVFHISHPDYEESRISIQRMAQFLKRER